MSTPMLRKGFSAVEVLIVLVVVGVIGFAGYTFLNNADAKRAKNLPPQASERAATEPEVPAAPAIENTQDLDKASAALDAIEPGSDTSGLDSEANSF